MNNHDLPQSDYVSPGFAIVRPDHAFTELMVGDTSVPRWRWLRRWVEHNWYTDRRNPDVGFASRDEASILYNAALLVRGRACLEIGCWRGWSAVHLALGCGPDTSGTLDVIDPIFENPDFARSVRACCEATGVSSRVTLHTGLSPEMVDSLAAANGRRWALVFIDGDHEGDAPRRDAEAAIRHAADTCIVLFHDLASPFVAAGLHAMRDAGWHTMVYQTMQIMGVAWRGDIEPPRHIPDPNVFWTLPSHLSGYPVSGWQRPTLSKAGGWWQGMTDGDRRNAALMRAQAAEDSGTDLLLQHDRLENEARAALEGARLAEAAAERSITAALEGARLAEVNSKAAAERSIAAALERASRAEADAEAAADLLIAARATTARLSSQAASARAEATTARDEVSALDERLTSSALESASAQAANVALLQASVRAVQLADGALALTSGWASAMPRIDELAHWVTAWRVLLGLLRRRPDARLAAMRGHAALLHQIVPEESLHFILRRRVLLGLLRRTRSHGQGIVTLKILEALARRRCREAEELRSALTPIGAHPVGDLVTARRMLGRLDWLLGHFDPAGPELYRPLTPEPVVAVPSPADNGRENVLLVVHETSRTGAPILGWNIAVHLSRCYNVFTVTLGDGPLTPNFVETSVETHGPFPNEHRTPEALAHRLQAMLEGHVFRYAIINSCESRPMVAVCAARGIPTVMLMHEFAASVYAAQELRDAMDTVDELVFPAAIVARSAYEMHPTLQSRKVRILPQGMCALPEAKVASDEPADSVVGDLAKARLAGGFVVLGAGTVDYRKGVDLFLTAAMAVQRDAPELGVCFVWVGHGYRPAEDKGYSAYLGEQIARSGLTGSVTLLDAVPDLDPIYAITDTFLLTSRLDPMPNVSIDAACRGIPIVCFRDASGTADVLLSDAETARGVVDYLDAFQAAAEIIGLARDRASHRRRVAATSALASTVFDMKRYVAAVNALGVGVARDTKAMQGDTV